MKTFLAVLLAALVATCCFARPSEPHTPQPGSPERKAICDALRGIVQGDLRQEVVFKIDHIAVDDGWAFLRGVPQQPSGKPIDYKRTKYHEAIEEEMFDDNFCALLQKVKGQWVVIIHIIGATDVPWVDWAKEYGAPKRIFQ